MPDCYKTQKMCNKVVDTYTSATQFVSNQYKTLKVFDKGTDTCPFASFSVPD